MVGCGQKCALEQVFKFDSLFGRLPHLFLGHDPDKLIPKLERSFNKLQWTKRLVQIAQTMIYRSDRQTTYSWDFDFWAFLCPPLNMQPLSLNIPITRSSNSSCGLDFFDFIFRNRHDIAVAPLYTIESLGASQVGQ